MSDEWVIETAGLSVGYGEKVVLHDITVQIPRGRITCIIGGSGCGKSTFLRSLIGLATPRGGTLRVLGEDLPRLEGEARAKLLCRVGFMFQYGALLASLTIRENLSIPLRAHTDLSPEEIEAVVMAKLSQVHLTRAAHQLPGELSGGMRKRAGLARAMMLDPDLVFCDEPSAGLDPVTAADLDELLRALCAQMSMTMVVVTHELESIRRIADRIVMLDAGRVHFNGTLDEADRSDSPQLRTFFDRKAGGATGRGTTLLDRLLGGTSEAVVGPPSKPSPRKDGRGSTGES